MIEKKEFYSALDILQELDPAVLDCAELVFRGQPDSSLPLIPAVWREDRRDDFNKFKSNIDSSLISTFVRKSLQESGITDEIIIINMIEWCLFVKFENYILASFYEISNTSGLKVSERDLRTLGLRNPAFWKSHELPERKIGDLLRSYKENQIRCAEPLLFEPHIPQHYGLSTRILDWTRNPRKAMFFAAYSFLNRREKNTEVESFSIYSLEMNKAFKNKTLNPILLKELHHRYDNHFLKF